MIQINCPTHPGEFLLDMWPKGVSLTEGAQRLGIARSELCNFLNGKTHITYDIALKLESWGEIKADMWMRMQAAHDQWLKNHQSHANDTSFQKRA